MAAASGPPGSLPSVLDASNSDDQTSIAWQDPLYPHALNRFTVMHYFEFSPFFDRASNNMLARRQNLDPAVPGVLECVPRVRVVPSVCLHAWHSHAATTMCPSSFRLLRAHQVDHTTFSSTRFSHLLPPGHIAWLVRSPAASWMRANGFGNRRGPPPILEDGHCVFEMALNLCSGLCLPALSTWSRWSSPPICLSSASSSGKKGGRRRRSRSTIAWTR